jgi:hypothetical protein
MRIREVVLITLGTLATLTFVGFMFDYYVRTEEVQVIRRDMYFDSLILQEQIELRKKDSLLENQNEYIRKNLQFHDSQIKKIKEGLEKLRTQE